MILMAHKNDKYYDYPICPACFENPSDPETIIPKDWKEETCSGEGYCDICGEKMKEGQTK